MNRSLSFKDQGCVDRLCCLFKFITQCVILFWRGFQWRFCLFFYARKNSDLFGWVRSSPLPASQFAKLVNYCFKMKWKQSTSPSAAALVTRCLNSYNHPAGTELFGSFFAQAPPYFPLSNVTKKSAPADVSANAMPRFVLNGVNTGLNQRKHNSLCESGCCGEM